jgi:hypothetical protein
MTQAAIEKLKYPAGIYKKPEHINAADLTGYIKTIEQFPKKIKKETNNLTKDALNYLHRPEGWTIRQLVHHCADSHLNAFIRIKLTLTENKPTVKPYLENEWAKLPDTAEAPIEWSLMILEGVHNRWANLMHSMKTEDFQKTYIHPEYKREFKIEEVVCLYAWHCIHHLAHIKQAQHYKNNF